MPPLSKMTRGALLAGLLLLTGAGYARDVTPPAVLDEVGRLVEQHFYDPKAIGEDWRAMLGQQRAKLAAAKSESNGALTEAVDTVLGALRASHTQRYTRDQVAYYDLLDIFSRSRDIRRRLEELFKDGNVAYTGISVSLRRIDGRLMVDGVHQGGPAEKAGLLRGDEILSADGAPFSEIASFEQHEGKPVTLAVRRRAGDEPISLKVVPQRIEPNRAYLDAMRASMKVIERDGKKLGYIRIWSYARHAYQELLAESLWRGEFTDIDGLVLDLRGGWGGADPSYTELFVGGAPIMTTTNRKGEERLASFRWDRPVVAIVDGGTRSGKEVVARGLQQNGILLVGERSAGAVLAGQAFLLPDDSLLILAVLDVHVAGERLEGRGVVPDIPVPFKPLYSAGADPQFDAAIEALVGVVRQRGG